MATTKRTMKPFIVSMSDATNLQPACATVCADTAEAAVEFARNYFGDYRLDSRNKNRVTHVDTGEVGLFIYYHFTIEPFAV